VERYETTPCPSEVPPSPPQGRHSKAGSLGLPSVIFGEDCNSRLKKVKAETSSLSSALTFSILLFILFECC
jgi:hypothetical protein